ncbi:MAG: hypothetical protein NT072_12545 [Deltaproteobacteria bacterium]|nr:hypothetical protein [Deltaproteobacteria bacterium]
MSIKEIGMEIRRGPSGRARRHERGAALVLIVFAIVALAVIGAAIYGVMSTGTLNQTIAQQATKAYYLAESGVRIAAGEWKAANDATRNAKLAGLTGQTFDMPGGGQITIKVYPAWLYATSAYSKGATSLTLYYPGEPPLLDKDGTVTAAFPSRGLLKLKGETVPGLFTSLPTAGTRNATGTPVTFSIPEPFDPFSNTGFPYAIASGDEFFIGFVETTSGTRIFSLSASSCPCTSDYPGCGYPGMDADIHEGDCIILNNSNNQAQLFPSENGEFNLTMSDKSKGPFGRYRYDRRIINNNNSTATLTNIQGPPTSLFPFQLHYTSGNLYDGAATTQIYITGGVGFRSKATYGN